MIGAICRRFLAMAGWRVSGEVPPPGKYVMIAAPHTSNWDLLLMLGVAASLGIRVSWMGKAEIFRWPFAGLMRWLGGVPVKRHVATNMVEQMVEVFAAAQDLILAVPPEGTRSRADHWRSGFYHIAQGANVPVITGFLDYGTKTTGVGPLVKLSGDVGADMDRFRSFYGGMRGKRPEKQGPIRLQAEGG